MLNVLRTQKHPPEIRRRRLVYDTTVSSFAQEGFQLLIPALKSFNFFFLFYFKNRGNVFFAHFPGFLSAPLLLRLKTKAGIQPGGGFIFNL